MKADTPERDCQKKAVLIGGSDKSAANRNCCQQCDFEALLPQRNSKAGHQEEVVRQRNGQSIWNKKARTWHAEKAGLKLLCIIGHIMWRAISPHCLPEGVNKTGFVVSVGFAIETDIKEDRRGSRRKAIYDYANRAPFDPSL